MFKKFIRLIEPNPLDRMLKKAKRKNANNILLAWNRGVGDIALGLYAIVQRIKEFIPNADVTFLIRKDLQEGFELFNRVKVLIAPDWKRAKLYNVYDTLNSISVSPNNFDLIIPWPDPTYWVKWQRGKIIPKLKWKKTFENRYQNDFSIPKDKLIVGIQPDVETNYGLWRNWPKNHWEELFSKLEKNNIFVMLFGMDDKVKFLQENIIDLRGKTKLIQLIDLIKKYCFSLVLPDSGILSMIYYLDVTFPINVLSLWADPNNGILKQNVSSPNLLLKHYAFIGENKNLSTVTVDDVVLKILSLAKEKVNG